MTFDYLGVWAPAPDPLPTICPDTFRPLALLDRRWITETGAYVGDTIPVPAEIDTADPDVQWAQTVTCLHPYRERQVAATVLHTGCHPDAKVFREKTGKGAWLGAVSRRYKGRAVVSDVTRQADGEFGPVYKVTLTLDGLPCVWWTGENCWCHAGDEADVRYTVKAHGVADGSKYTQVSRVTREKPQ